MTRQERRSAERQRAAMDALGRVVTVPLCDALRAAAAGSVACGVLTRDVAATALGAVLAGLAWAVLTFLAQVVRPRARAVQIGAETPLATVEQALARAHASARAFPRQQRRG